MNVEDARSGKASRNVGPSRRMKPARQTSATSRARSSAPARPRTPRASAIRGADRQRLDPCRARARSSPCASGAIGDHDRDRRAQPSVADRVDQRLQVAPPARNQHRDRSICRHYRIISHSRWRRRPAYCGQGWWSRPYAPGSYRGEAHAGCRRRSRRSRRAGRGPSATSRPSRGSSKDSACMRSESRGLPNTSRCSQ